MGDGVLRDYREFKSDYRFAGQKVQSTQSYFDLTGRKVKGVVVEPKTHIGGDSLIVLWEQQEGNNVPNLVGNMVIMDRKHVETVDFEYL